MKQTYAYLEEIEQRMPATYPVEPISPDIMFNPHTLVDSGPRFSARIALVLPAGSTNAPSKEAHESGSMTVRRYPTSNPFAR